MRNYLKWGLPVLVVGMLAYLGWGFTTKLHRKQEASERIKALPAFTAYSLNRSRITTATLANRPAVLIFFDPDCEHCQQEAGEIHKHAAVLADAQVLTSAPVPALKTFAQAYQLTDLPNVQIAQIDRKVAYETFGFTSVPDVLVYHADGSLSKHFRGETSLKAIKRNL